MSHWRSSSPPFSSQHTKPVGGMQWSPDFLPLPWASINRSLPVFPFSPFPSASQPLPIIIIPSFLRRPCVISYPRQDFPFNSLPLSWNVDKTLEKRKFLAMEAFPEVRLLILRLFASSICHRPKISLKVNELTLVSCHVLVEWEWDLKLCDTAYYEAFHIVESSVGWKVGGENMVRNARLLGRPRLTLSLTMTLI